MLHAVVSVDRATSRRADVPLFSYHHIFSQVIWTRQRLDWLFGRRGQSDLGRCCRESL